MTKPSIKTASDAELEGVESFRRSIERRLNRKRQRLESVRVCQSAPEPDRLPPRSALKLFDRGYIYLMEELARTKDGHSIKYDSTPNCPYKIGATRHPKMRSITLWNHKRLISRAKYCTPVPFALEKALHRHFDEFRIKRIGKIKKGERKAQAGELFRLHPEQVEAFNETVAKIEHWVLIAEEARLELEIMRLEAVLHSPRFAEQSDARETSAESVLNSHVTPRSP